MLAAAQLKVHAVLPNELAERSRRIAERFHLDAPGWLRESDHVPTLTGIADAVWNQRVVRIRYRVWGEEEVERELEPLGVVLQSGVWFVVAAPHDGGSVRTYRVARVRTLETLERGSSAPRGSTCGGTGTSAPRR